MSAILVVISMESHASATSIDSSDDIQQTVDRVSGTNLAETIGDLEVFGTRAFYTSSGWNASIYVHDRFAELGYWVYYQNLEVSGFPARNVIAVKNGTNASDPLYLFGAHYDCANKEAANYSEGEILAAPGADDDASGVAAVIEIARILKETRLSSMVKFVAFAAEESGLNGSRYFARQEHDAGWVYENTALMDMIGYKVASQNRAMIFSGSPHNTLAPSMVSAIDTFNLDLSAEIVTGYDLTSSDHASFWEVGYPSLLVIEELVNSSVASPYYHTSQDTLSTLSVDQMVEITKAVLGGFLLLENPLKTEGLATGTIAVIGVVVAVAVILAVVYLVRHRRVEP